MKIKVFFLLMSRRLRLRAKINLQHFLLRFFPEKVRSWEIIKLLMVDRKNEKRVVKMSPNADERGHANEGGTAELCQLGSMAFGF